MNDHDHDSPHAAMDQPTRGGAPGPWSPSDGTGEAAIDQTTQSTADLASHSVPPIPPQGSSNSTLLKVTVGMTAAFLLVAVAILGVVLLGGDDEPQFRSAKTANDEPAERSADEEDAAGTTATPDDAPSTNSLRPASSSRPPTGGATGCSSPATSSTSSMSSPHAQATGAELGVGDPGPARSRARVNISDSSHASHPSSKDRSRMNNCSPAASTIRSANSSSRETHSPASRL